MDPLTISTGQGKGLAQVLPSSGKSPYDLYTDYLKVKGAKEVAKKKEVADVFQGLDDIKLGGFVKDTQYLYDMKNKLQGHLKNQYVQQGNKYNYVTDEKLIKDVNKLKELNQFSENTKGLFNTELTKLQAGKDQWDPTSVEQVTTFYNLPIEDRYDYINNGGVIPTLKAKEIAFNPVELEQKYTAPLKPSKSGGYKLLPDGSVLDWESTSYENKNSIYKDIFSTPEGEKYKTFLTSEFDKKSANEQKNIIENSRKAGLNPVQYIAKQRLDKYLETGYKDSIKKADGQYVEGGNSVKIGDWSYTYNPNTGEVDIANVKSEMENKPYSINIEEGGKQKSIKAIPVSWDYKGSAKGKPALIVMDVTGTTPKKRKIPYEIAVSKMANITGSDVSEVEKALKEKGAFGGTKDVTTVGEPTGSENTISLSDAKKANPGVSDAELVKRYAKYGYKVK